MYARLTCVVCLLLMGAAALPAEKAVEDSNELAVYLRNPAGASTTSLDAMRSETDALMGANGRAIDWLPAPREVSALFLVILEFDGSCELSDDAPAAASIAPTRLASTVIENGRILPFVRIDCEALRRFLTPLLAGRSKQESQLLFGRALGRVLAHELHHVADQTTDHTSAGVTRAAVSIADLTVERAPRR